MAHVPVLGREAVAFLSPHDGGVYVDATFGGGGYSRAILEAAACQVVAIDCDPEAAERAKPLEEAFLGRFSFKLGNFQGISRLLEGIRVDGVVFDLGVSSFQLDDAARGFSFQHNGPLDMRMSKEGLSAEEVVNTFSAEQLTQIIRLYGEERYASRVAFAIIKKRGKKHITTTEVLAEVVRSVVPRQGKIDAATRTFQALRIFVNDELRHLQEALDGVENMVRSGPSESIRVVTVAFHSLEDRLVKNWIRGINSTPEGRSHLVWHDETTRVILPSEEEIQANPRSRSARLRSVVVSRRLP